jgi:uncharacterized membrane protein
MTNKEAICKALIWRLAISVPVSMLINFTLTNDIATSIYITVIGNILGTILYFAYDKFWFAFRETEIGKKIFR